MSDDELVNLWSKITFQAIFTVATIIYLLRLNKLNNDLKNPLNNVDVSNPFEVVAYNGYSPFWFAILALILVILAVFLVIWYFRTMIDMSQWQFFALWSSTTVLNIIGVSWIWHLINNPILRAVIVVLIAGVGIISAIGSSSN